MTGYNWTRADAGAYLDFCDVCGIEDITIPLFCWAHESDNEPGAHNPNGNASGLGQLEPDTARGLGYPLASDPTLAAFRALTVEAQLAWWTQFYAPSRGSLNSLGRFYLKTFLPVELEHGDDPDYVTCGHGGPPSLAWAYEANWRGFDAKPVPVAGKLEYHRDKGCITVRDLVSAAVRSVGPRTEGILAVIESVQRERSTNPEIAELAKEALDAVDVSHPPPEPPEDPSGGQSA